MPNLQYHWPAIVLATIGAFSVGMGVFAFVGPSEFYETIPGLAAMGAYNVHLVRDVGLALIASGATMTVGAWRRNRELALAGAAWPVLHAVLHLALWVGRGFALDAIAAFDLLIVIVPAILAAACVNRLGHRPAR